MSVHTNKSIFITGNVTDYFDSLITSKAGRAMLFRTVLQKKASQKVAELEAKKNDVALSMVDVYKREATEYVPPVPTIFVPPNDALRDILQGMPTPGIPREFTWNIICRLGRNRYPAIRGSLVADLLREAKEENEAVLQNLGIERKVNRVEGRVEPTTLSPYRMLGRTKRYDRYLKTREHVRKTLFLSSAGTQFIHKIAMDDLPPHLIAFEKYNKGSVHTIEELQEKINQELNVAQRTIHKEWYAAIKTFLRKEHIRLDQKTYLKYLHSCSSLVALHLSNFLRRSIDYFLECFEDAERCPRLLFKIRHDSKWKFYIEPTVERALCFYHSVIDNLAKACYQMHPFEHFKFFGYDDKFIRPWLPEDYINEMHDRLNNGFAKYYELIKEHLEGFQQNFGHMFTNKRALEIQDETGREELPVDVKIDVEELIDKPIDPTDTRDKPPVIEDTTMTEEEFNEELDWAAIFQSYLNDINYVFDKEIFVLGCIDQSDISQELKETAYSYREHVLDKLKKRHAQNNIDICLAFQEIARYALHTPKDTMALMEMGEYMLHARTVIIPRLTERLQDSLNRLARLIEVTSLSEEHIRLNRTAVNWLGKLAAVLEENAAIFEQNKFLFEENLQKKIDAVNDDVVQLAARLAPINNMEKADRAREYLDYFSAILVRMRDIEKIISWINEEETHFKFPLSNFPVLEEIKRVLFPFYRLCALCNSWNRYSKVWKNGPFERLNFNFISDKMDEIYKELTDTAKLYRNKISTPVGDAVEMIFQFSGSIDDPDPNNLPTPLKMCAQTLQDIKQFRPAARIIGIMCQDALLQRHWDEMSQAVGFDITPNAGTTLEKIVNLGLADHMDKFEVISMSAVREHQLLGNLNKMQEEWVNVRFKTSKYKTTDITILTALEDVQAILDEHLVKTLTMLGSVFVKPYKTKAKEWYEKLMRINVTCENWGKVQAQWLYLMPIFSSPDIMSQMPDETALFKRVNTIFQRLMSAVERDDRVMETAPVAGVLESLEECLEYLDEINEGVVAYLEKKRLFFARFFFLSNDEMLEILSETKDPLKVQPHLSKCFEGINRLEFDQEKVIHSMLSREGEKVVFVETVNTEQARGSVEKWLLQVENQMVLSVKNEIYRAYKDYAKQKRTKWVQCWAGQAILAVSQMYWTAQVHSSIKNGTLKSLFRKLGSNLEQLVDVIRSPDLTRLAQISIKALIVIDVHAKDVVEELVRNKVDKETDFSWLSQLRYYWEDNALVRIINVTVPYAYEYLGNTDRLVITPLTDRCYRTLIGAYSLNLNGAPEGPAGTGKTETTKDLAKALAVQCVVFNCSEGLDYKAMGKFFKGLASSGAWACFDEFNRIELEVLSVIAQQILNIILAIRARLTKFVFEGTELKLNSACYICITMNPGYAGRSELPDNLKVLFRTVAMMVPDYAMIGEISLYSYGFRNARVLAAKIVTTYRLCSEQLSNQNHYDYGMRAVKTVLSACGNNKQHFPNENEEILLLRSLVDVNLPKFLAHDVPLFKAIISDLFPGVQLTQPVYASLMKAVHVACAEHKAVLIPTETFLTKITQTYEMMIVRHGFMLVGQPFAGKTCVLRTLASALTATGTPTHFETINPKSVTMGQLYGQFDPVSFEWNDGIIPTHFRKFALDETVDRNWVVFDGPVDAVWIENMNTVLDDNKKLCLTSGEVITMTGTMSMIFEVMDLEQASPATVSRCGMIYMEPANLGFRPLVESWTIRLKVVWAEGILDEIKQLAEWVLEATTDFIEHHCKLDIRPGFMSMYNNMLVYWQLIMDDACLQSKETNINYMSWIEASLLIATSWVMGGVLDDSSKEKFDLYLRDLFKNTVEKYLYPPFLEKMDFPMPPEGSISDYTFNYKMKGSWRYLPDIVKTVQITPASTTLQTIVPTVDSIKYQTIMEQYIVHNIPTILLGPTGTGKSFYMQNLLIQNLDQSVYEANFLTFTTQTGANQTQENILTKLTKLKQGIFGAAANKMSVIFIDDINMPAKDIYGAQAPIELLRQLLDQQFWYDLKRPGMKITFERLHFCAAMGPVGGSRQDLYARFLRHFAIFSIYEFSEETMTRIFSNVLLLKWKNNGFPADSISTIHVVVQATLRVYTTVLATLLPTPTKSHYVFNLRDFSRVIEGCGLLRKESVDGKKTFGKLWVHEILRVFYDRLVTDADKTWLFEKIKDLVQDFFKEKFDFLFENLQNEEKVVPQSELNNVLFGSYLDTDTPMESRKYEEISSLEEMKKISELTLEEYNATNNTKMNIVLFRYALEHLSRLCRVLSMPQGNSLLVGMGGSGRQSLTRLAAAIYNFKLFTPEISKNYSVPDFREDLKKVLKESGGAGKHCVFLFGESQVKEEAFLQDIDSLLNSGEIPNLFPIDERQEILEMVRGAAQTSKSIEMNALSVFAFFVNRCRERLHIVVCFSPIGSSFRTRLRLYPSLINCCTIDWYVEWPEDALEMVAHRWMAGVNLSQEVKESAVLACKHFHVTCRIASDKFFAEQHRKTYITSSSYLELIQSYQLLVNKKQQELMLAKERYVLGLGKLLHAASQVAGMQVSLAELQPKLVIMSDKANQMTKMIEEETVEAEKAAEMVQAEEKVANKQAAEAKKLKSECEKELALAIPVLEDAIQALNTLKPADIVLVKSMKNPPLMVKTVMAAVCVLMGIKPDRVPDPSTGRKVLDFWGPSKKLLGEMNFLQKLKDYDKDNIPVQAIGKIRSEYIPNKDFKPNIVAKASSAAEGLCKWIIAMDMYDAVAREVAPKKEKLSEAEKSFAATIELLREKRDEVTRLEQRLEKLNEQLVEAAAEQSRLQETVDLCTLKLIRAEQLVNGLGGEKQRWTDAANNLQAQYETLPGDILISCGVIAYLAPLNIQYRQTMTADWWLKCQELSIPCSGEFDFCKILGSQVVIQGWHLAGLPTDTFSTQNAIIQSSSKRWSLLIDPQNQANRWIKNMEKRNNLHVMKLTEPTYMKMLEECIELGSPALIENIAQELDPSLDPILFKHVFKQAGIEVIALGENVISYHPRFKLYMTSSQRNPHYSPEVFNKVTIVNFSLTQDGLEDQLLGIVVAKERPDLQTIREDIVSKNAENRAALEQVEILILKTLSETKGDILEDESAVEILNHSKHLAQDIQTKQLAAEKTEKRIEKFRLDYKPVAVHSSMLYYTICDLPNVDPMYQYSLGWFIQLYINTIDTSVKVRDLETRLHTLMDSFTLNLYQNVCRSLFEKDKLMYSFILCAKVMISKNQVLEHELAFLLSGGVEVENKEPNPLSWTDDKKWKEICRLNSVPGFDSYKKNLLDNQKAWKTYYDSKEPQLEPMPTAWGESLSGFQKLVILRTLRMDKISKAVYLYVQKNLGQAFVVPPPFDIEKSFAGSSCLTPLIFVLSSGADPMAALQAFAQKKAAGLNFESISLGQGQGPIAQVMIEKAMNAGSWVCLQNCHLAASWMPQLESLCEKMDFNNTKESFRIWLTSYPSDKFPTTILQNGVKMTNELASGLKQNLLRNYLQEPLSDPAFYGGCIDKEQLFTKFLYAISFFHAIVLERLTFGPIGWNIPYGFNDSDFNISVQQIQRFLNEYIDVPYDGITYMIGECNYGGRVTDFWDRRLILTILRDLVTPRLAGRANVEFSDQGPWYGLPRMTDYLEVIKHIEQMPTVHTPEVFGLHKNAGMTRDLYEARSLLNACIEVQGERAASVGKDTDELLNTIILDILGKIPPPFDVEQAMARYPVDYAESMNTVLIQELVRFNILTTRITSSLKSLRDAIKGLAVMTVDIETLLSSVLLGKIPATWMKVSYPSLKTVSAYIEDLVQRISFFAQWEQRGKPPVFWLSGFFFTQAFLTGVKQNYARHHSIPIDQLDYDFDVQKSDTPRDVPKTGVLISGLFLEGASWERETSTLREQADKVLFDNMPLIWIKVERIEKIFFSGKYQCPLYKTTERRGVLSTTGHSTNYVLPFYLPTAVPSTHWIKRSAALFLQLN